MKKLTTITVTVNIASADKWEGNSELRIDMPEEHLQYLSPERMQADLAKLVEKAVADYNARNGGAR